MWEGERVIGREKEEKTSEEEKWRERHKCTVYSRFTVFEEEVTAGEKGPHYVSVVEKHSPDFEGQGTSSRKSIQLVGDSPKPITGRGRQ